MNLLDTVWYQGLFEKQSWRTENLLCEAKACFPPIRWWSNPLRISTTNEEDPRRPALITTETGVGYRFERLRPGSFGSRAT